MNWTRFFRRWRMDQEIVRDLEFYVDAETEDNIARGMTPDDAHAAALRKLGNPTLIREDVYRMNTMNLIESIWQDLRYAFRVLRLNPTFTAICVISLALGIGGNTAVFTVIRGVLLRPLPYPEPDRLVKLAMADPHTVDPDTVDFTTTNDLRNRTRSFETLTLYRDGVGAMADGGQPELLEGMRVNYDYFTTLGAKMQLGRAFLPEEDRPDRRYVAILTHGFWIRRFGGNPDVIGRVLRLNDSSYSIVGVLPQEFRPLPEVGGAKLPEFYSPLGYALDQPFACRGCQHLRLIGRLKQGVSLERASGELNSALSGIVREHPTSYAEGSKVMLIPLAEHYVGHVRTAMWILLGAVGFVLLIACANVTNLALARATRRAKEMSLRAALGAGRLRLVRQLILESLLIAFASGIAGLFLAWIVTPTLVALGPKSLAGVHDIRIDPQVLWFTFAASVVSVLLSGMLPALGASRADAAESLKDSSRSTPGRSSRAVRNLLVTGELALAFLLLVGAGLLAKSFVRLTGVDLGYDPHNVLTLGVYVYGERYKKPEAELNFYSQVMDRIRATPGVDSIGMTSILPLDSFDRRGFHIQDRRVANESDVPFVDAYSVSPDYFRVMRIRLMRGRLFTAADRLGSGRVALISESCARSQFPHEDPIGKHIQLGGRHDDREWLTIVGVVGGVRQFGVDQPSRMEAYIAQAQDTSFSYNMVVRTTTDPWRMAQSVRAAFLAVDPTQPVYHVRPMESYVSDSLSARTFALVLLGLFGALALVLAAIGVYGLVSYTVSLRTSEVGIRMALGAAQRDVLLLVLRHGMLLAAGGLLVGVCASLALTRLLGAMLYEVRPTDLAMSAGSALVLAAVALAAAYIPARRATRIDPIMALRIG